MARKKATAKRSTRKTVTKTAKKAVAKRVTKNRAGRPVKTAAKKATAKKSVVAESGQIIVKARAQLGNALEKEVAQLDKGVTRLKAQLERAIAQHKAQSAKKVATKALADEKGTQAAKNQASRARAALQAARAKVTGLRNQMKEAKETLANAKVPHKKHAAEMKVLAKFEKEWAKITASKPKRRVRRRTRKPAVASVDAPGKGTETASAPAAEEK